MSIITTRRFSLWWTLAKEWFTSKFNSISIDTTSLAKQGSDQSVSLTGVDTKLGDAMDALDGINNGDSSQVIIGQGVVENVEEINDKIGTPAEGQAGTLFEAIKNVDSAAIAYNEGKELIAQAITNKGIETQKDASFSTMANNINAIENGLTIPETYYSTTNGVISNYKDIIFQVPYITAIRDPNISELADYAFNGFNQLKEVELNGIEQIGVSYNDNYIYINRLISLKMNNLKLMINNYGFYAIDTKLTSLFFPKLESCNGFLYTGNNQSIVSIDLPRLKYIGNKAAGNVGSLYPYVSNGNFATLASIEKLYLPELEYLSIQNGYALLRECQKCEEIILPKLHYIQIENSNRYFTYGLNANLKKIVIHSLDTNPSVAPTNIDYGKDTDGRYNTFPCDDYNNGTKAPNLIHFELLNPTDTCIRMAGWHPTNAMKNDSSSLVLEGEAFSNNREKLLYNIRTYIADRLVNNTAGKNRKIIFDRALYQILDTETIQAFTNKGYIVTGV